MLRMSKAPEFHPVVVPSSLTVEDTVAETPSVDWSACPARKQKHAVKSKNMSQIPADQTETLQEAVAHLRQRVAALETRLDRIDERDGEDSEHVAKFNSTSDVPRRTGDRELSTKLLDQSDMMKVSESVWDSCLFVGLPCVGVGVSSSTTLRNFLKKFLQLGFTAFVFIYLLEDPVSPDTLDDLLRFRLGVGHSAQSGNQVTHTSMIAELCGNFGALHTTAKQTTLYEDLQSFGDACLFLCVLAQISWFVLTMAEMTDTGKFVLALESAPRDQTTNIVVTGGCGTWDDKLQNVTVVTRLVSLSPRRRFALFLFVVVPRLLIATTLGITGGWYLALATNQGELILNVVALNFVISLDEGLCRCLVPRRVCTALSNMEPLRVKSSKVPPSSSLVKFVFLGVAVVSIYLVLLNPFFGRLFLAQRILCSGDTDFIYAVNPATGVVYVARAEDVASVDGWSATERAVFQVAQPDVTDVDRWVEGWVLHADLAESGASTVLATVHPNRTADLQDISFELSSFEQVAVMSTNTVSEGSQHLSCFDLDAGASTAASLLEVRSLLGNNSVEGCGDDLALALQSCSDPEMSRFRAFCPVTCGCADRLDASLSIDDATGWPATIFGSVAFGCPGACIANRQAFSGILFRRNSSSIAIGSQCADVPVEHLTNPSVDFDHLPSVDEAGAVSYDFNSMYIPRRLHGYANGLLALSLLDQTFTEYVWHQAQRFEVLGHTEPGSSASLWQHVVSCGIVDTIVGGTWACPGRRTPAI